MKVSLNQIKQFIDFELPPIDELVQKLNAQLGVVEEVINLADKYKDARIVKVVECEKHPNADRLNVTKIDAGDFNGSSELVQVVCGAPNVHADMWAVWLPPESTVPATYGDDEPFVLGARELRGVMSHGMLAAADELDLGSDHEGILEIKPDEWKPSDVTIVPGSSFAEVYGLDEYVVDIENKMFTHRPDLFGQLGVAREIAGIYGHQFTSPSWYIDTPQFTSGEGLELTVTNEATDKVPRFMAVAMKNVDVTPSPVWLQCALVAMGAKPINNIVDVTNYVMLLTAQPTHAYDYDKLRGHTLVARMAVDGEKAELLNGKTYELTSDDIVIADGEGVVGVGGIMGGSNSEVSSETKNIVLEVATFDMYAVRKTSMRHGLFTDALTRFNKGQSPLQNDHVLNLLMMSIHDVSMAEPASDIRDAADTGSGPETVTFTPRFINERLGLALDKSEMQQLLRNVEVIADSPDDHDTYLEAYPPFWRTDIEQAEDIVEEIGRLYGFDKLPRELPLRSSAPTQQNPEIAAKQRLRDTLARAGGNEVLTYSFVHEKVLLHAGQDSAQAYKLSNALSPDLQYYRLSVLPSLLDKVHMNSKAGHDEFLLYEIGKVHHVDARDDASLPQEFAHAAGVYAAKAGENAYYQVKRIVEYVVDTLLPGARTRYERLDTYTLPESAALQQMVTVFDPVRSAAIEIDGVFAGVIGEFRQSAKRGFKLPAGAAGFELLAESFVGTRLPKYQPLARYQTVQRDVSFRVASDVAYGAVVEAAGEYATTEAAITSEPAAIYQPEASETKTITLRFTLTPHHATLTNEAATALIDAISARIVGATGAEVV